MNSPYIFYFKTPYGLVEFPITPGELTISNGSNNKVITLINEGEVNILKSPALIEVNFEARFPTRRYPYSTDNVAPILYYHEIFTKLKENKTPFTFHVTRTGFAETSTGDTDLLVSLEELETKESADEGDDVIYTFTLKQYKEYSVVNLPNSYKRTTTSTASPSRSTSKGVLQSTYTVQSGDCLWNIAKAAYGDGSKWTVIYNANKTVIESTAEQRRGKGKGSSNGHWIYPGTKLTIPDINNANLQVQKLKQSSSSNGSKNTKNNSTTSTNSASKNLALGAIGAASLALNGSSGSKGTFGGNGGGRIPNNTNSNIFSNTRLTGGGRL